MNWGVSHFSDLEHLEGRVYAPIKVENGSENANETEQKEEQKQKQKQRDVVMKLVPEGGQNKAGLEGPVLRQMTRLLKRRKYLGFGYILDSFSLDQRRYFFFRRWYEVLVLPRMPSKLVGAEVSGWLPSVLRHVFFTIYNFHELTGLRCDSRVGNWYIDPLALPERRVKVSGRVVRIGAMPFCPRLFSPVGKDDGAYRFGLVYDYALFLRDIALLGTGIEANEANEASEANEQDGKQDRNGDWRFGVFYGGLTEWEQRQCRKLFERLLGSLGLQETGGGPSPALERRLQLWPGLKGLESHAALRAAPPEAAFRTAMEALETTFSSSSSSKIGLV